MIDLSPTEDLFICETCGREYKTESGLDSHVADKHSRWSHPKPEGWTGHDHLHACWCGRREGHPLTT